MKQGRKLPLLRGPYRLSERTDAWAGVSRNEKERADFRHGYRDGYYGSGRQAGSGMAYHAGWIKGDRDRWGPVPETSPAKLAEEEAARRRLPWWKRWFR